MSPQVGIMLLEKSSALSFAPVTSLNGTHNPRGAPACAGTLVPGHMEVVGAAHSSPPTLRAASGGLPDHVSRASVSLSAS